MKCLSVRQPFAWEIIYGSKRIENRSWPTNHRGPLAIHAGKSREGFRGGVDFAETMPDLPDPAALTYGAVIGVVDVVDCVPYEVAKDRPFAKPLGYCWVLANPRPIEPVPFAGKLGLFEVDLTDGAIQPGPTEGPAIEATPAQNDADLAELRAGRARLRMLGKSGEIAEHDADQRARLRAELIGRSVARSWAAYLMRWGFRGEIAEALAKALASPSMCDPGWFQEAMIAVRRAGLDPATLDYPAIREAIATWRADRYPASTLEATA